MGFLMHFEEAPLSGFYEVLGAHSLLFQCIEKVADRKNEKVDDSRAIILLGKEKKTRIKNDE